MHAISSHPEAFRVAPSLERWIWDSRGEACSGRFSFVLLTEAHYETI